jgi:hypothetical protein
MGDVVTADMLHGVHLINTSLKSVIDPAIDVRASKEFHK